MNHKEDKARRGAAKYRFLAAFLGVLLFGLGYLFGHANLKLDEHYIPRLVKKDVGRPNDVDFSLFWDTYQKISSESLDQIDAQEALYGAISGLVDSLQDPYSTFLTPAEARALLDDLAGKLEGIGAEIGRRNGVPVVITPLDGSPAEQAGLRKGDEIMAIDGQSTANLSLDAAVLKIRGEKGTTVKLTILRGNEDAPREITITRDEITVQDVEWHIDGSGSDKVAVVRIRQFGDSVSSQLQQVATDVQNQGITRVVIDLRDNPGGLLDKVVETLGFFLPRDSVAVKQISRGDQTEELKTTTYSTLKDVTLAVLVNEGSASASEIFAGAIQDNKRGVIVGTRTFGKGTVQSLEELRGSAALKLTIAKWQTPSGREINQNGIEPDIAVALSEDDSNAGRDPQLEKALVEVRR